ncbi:hypothetical protein Taro_014224 [Colocasia esculenta]|uniref:Uncharacterized protein n=1 Tax=Colocasia esculenta TaxID=4460 RepID=A0A843UE41_COLES|nr:hypothetical protein [Colocasia esculenta]
MRFLPTISPIPRYFGSSDSLDYANRWRSPHAEPPSHSDRKSCSTRREISSPGRGYGCPNIADIVTPSVLSTEKYQGQTSQQKNDFLISISISLLTEKSCCFNQVDAVTTS